MIFPVNLLTAVSTNHYQTLLQLQPGLCT